MFSACSICDPSPNVGIYTVTITATLNTGLPEGTTDVENRAIIFCIDLVSDDAHIPISDTATIQDTVEKTPIT